MFGVLRQGRSSYSSTQCHGRTYVWSVMAARLGYVQGDSQGNVSVLAGHSNGEREKKKSSYEQVSDYEWLLGENSLNLQIKEFCEW